MKGHQIKGFALAAAIAAVALTTLAPSALAQSASAASLGLPSGNGRELVVRACTSCHQADKITAVGHTPDQWDQIIGKMIDKGAKATDSEQDQILNYLASHFPAKIATTNH